MIRPHDSRSGSTLLGRCALWAMLVCLSACEDGSVDAVDRFPNAQATPPGLVLSEVGPAAASPSGVGDATISISVAYLSASPGTFPGASSVDIRNLTAGYGPLSLMVVEGGFDPIGVPASGGDEIELEVYTAGQSSVLYLTVPEDRPPVVVRTEPQKGRTDVALQVQLKVIFSEPMDSTTLDETSVRLLRVRDGNLVPASVELDPESPFTASIVPNAPLEPVTTYSMVVTTAVRSLDGGALESEVDIGFTTRQPSIQISIVSGDGQSARVGTALADPLVVRVSDADGTPLKDVSVVWQANGDGALDGFTAEGAPIDSVATWTDTLGFTRASLIPTTFSIQYTEAWVCAQGCEGPTVMFRTDASDPDAVAQVVSGNNQQVDAGQTGDPLVVRVIDGEGNPIPHAETYWGITYGKGTFDADTLARYVRSWTDADGQAQAFVWPLWFAGVDAEVRLEGQDRPSANAFFVMDAEDPGASIEIVSGDGQIGKANEQLAEPLVVRVTNGRGEPVERVDLDWLTGPTWGDMGGGSLRSSGLVAGLDSVHMTPQAAGTVWADALLPGDASRRVHFEAQATDFVIWLEAWEGFVDGWGYVNFNWFTGNVFHEDCWTTCYAITQVPVGTPLEWALRGVPEGHIVSTSVPDGGASFDSGVLSGEARFSFVPTVTGKWTYIDELSGAVGWLIVF